MSEWLGLIVNPLTSLEGWPRVLFVVAWQSTFVVLITLIAAKCVRRPATTSLVLLLGIVASVLAPVCTLMVHERGWGALPVVEARAAISNELLGARLPVGSEGDHDVLSTQSEAPIDSELIADRPPMQGSNSQLHAVERPSRTLASAPTVETGWAGGLVVVWAIISTLFLVRLAGSVHRMLRIVKRSTACSDPRIVELAAEVAAKAQVAAPRVLLSREVRCPMVVTLRNVLVLVPCQDEQLFPANGQFNAVAFRAMLRHELAHARRRDGWSRLAIEIVIAMLPWQPLMWLLRTRFHAAAEEACDDWAVFEGTNPLDLAELLTAYVSHFSHNPIGVTMYANDTKRRILRLLSTSEMQRPATGVYRRMTLASIAAGIVVTVAAAQQPADKSVVTSEDKTQGKKTATALAIENEQNEADKAKVDRAKQGFSKDRPYRIEPPDILKIEVGKLVPASPNKIEKLDSLQIAVDNALVDSPIAGIYRVNSEGQVNLGAMYGKVVVAGLTEEDAAAAVDKHLRAILREPRVSLTIAQMNEQYFIAGEHLVGPDGNINLGVFGSVQVNGLTLNEAKREIENKLLTMKFQEVSLALDVHSYNSKVYYVVEDNETSGDRIRRVALTGNESVLDALASVESLRIGEHTRIWIARAVKNEDGSKAGDEKLEVDWDAIVKQGDSKSNYPLLPGDRVFVAQESNAEERARIEKRMRTEERAKVEVQGTNGAPRK